MSNTRAIGLFLLLAVLACALFAGTASCVLLVAFITGAIEQPPPFLVRISIKAFGFFVAAAAAAAWYWRARPVLVADHPQDSSSPFSKTHILVLGTLLLLACALLLPRLNTYPYPEPDELHHLIVARNLAVHGDYASGHRDSGLIHFDPYDSVGAPVLLPVAASLKVFGVSLGAGRLPIAVSFLVLIVLLILLFRPMLGTAPALLGGLVFLIAWGSIYLGRSVYGEVPALMFLVAALLVWRRSLAGHAWLFATLAGVLLGLATLSKTILLLTVFPFAVVVLHDRLTALRLGLPQVLMPPLGVVTAQISWSLLTASGTGAGTFALYQHNLMFGFTSVPGALHWVVWSHALYFIPALGGLALLAPRVLSRRDPAILVACLTTLLYLFWWCFFTDAHIPRYLWFSVAILAFPLAYVLYCLAVFILSFSAGPLGAAALAIIIAVLAPFAPLLRYELERIFGTVRVMRDETALLVELDSLPDHTKLCTTWWPLERWSHFFLDRPMPVAPEAAAALDTCDVVVDRVVAGDEVLIRSTDARRIGPYIIYRKEPQSIP